MSTQQSSPTIVGSVADGVVDLIKERGELQPHEYVVHFNLVVMTRRVVAGREVIERHHWAAVGADPHTSYGVLSAEASRILKDDLT